VSGSHYLAPLNTNSIGSLGSSPNASYFGGNVTAAVTNGTVEQARLDDMVTRIMTPYFYLNQAEYPPIDGEEPALNSRYPPYQYPFTIGTANVDVRDSHAQLIRELGAAGTVLLKNSNGTLPLQAPKTIGIFGNDAGDVLDGLYFSNAATQGPQGFGM
jgi:beta-glucosidase